MVVPPGFESKNKTNMKGTGSDSVPGEDAAASPNHSEYGLMTGIIVKLNDHSLVRSLSSVNLVLAEELISKSFGFNFRGSSVGSKIMSAKSLKLYA